MLNNNNKKIIRIRINKLIKQIIFSINNNSMVILKLIIGQEKNLKQNYRNLEKML